MGTNQFTALTREEFKQLHLSTYPTLVQNPIDNSSPIKLNIDWVSYGAVSPVKNEGNCQANYAFSAIGAIEGISVIFYKQQQEYSTQ